MDDMDCKQVASAYLRLKLFPSSSDKTMGAKEVLFRGFWSYIMIPLHLAGVTFRLFGALVFLAVFSGEMGASGSYMVRPVHPSGRLIEDSQRYELGKAIFFGKAPLKDQANADKGAQRSVLVGLQERLPPRVKKTIDLPTLSGRLSGEQLIALQHFLRVRHKID